MKIRRFRRLDASGWPTQMHVIAAPSGESVLYSPTWVDDATLEEIAETSNPSHIVAPNHYHHLGLSRYRSRFSHAQVLASRTAISRLRSKGHTHVTALDEIGGPENIRWILPEGLKNGEVWLSVQTPLGTEWIVGDAFFNVSTSVRGMAGLFLRATGAVPGLSVGKTFRWLGVHDPERFCLSIDRWLDEECPSRMHFCHGEALALTEASRSHMRDLLRTRLSLT